MVPSIQEWLTGLGLEKYARDFERAEIDVSTLPDLLESDLKELGLPLGPRRKIWTDIERLRQSAEAQETETSVTPSTGPFSTNAGPQPERRHLTVMFVDLVGSTEMAGRMDAEDMREVFTQYQNCVTGMVKRYKGFVATLMGDGVLCYFGWPQANEDDTERAVRAGLAIIESAGKIATPDGAALSVRVGVAAGVVVVGDMVGDDARQQAAVVGETPNLAARLQAIAEPNQLVIPDDTLSLLGSVFEVMPLGAQTLKGVGRSVKAFVVRGEASTESRFSARRNGELTPIVGRETEISAILGCWIEAQAGRGRMAVVTGEAGIGKSRLTRAIYEHVKRADSSIAVFQCSPYHTDSALYPLMRPLNAWIGILPQDTTADRLDKIEDYVGGNLQNAALLAQLLGVDSAERFPAPKATPIQQRTQLIQLLVNIMSEQARERPLLLVFEDLHWIDPTSKELLAAAIGALPENRILMLATTRPESAPDLSNVPKLTRINLTRLPPQRVHVMISRLTTGLSLPDEILQAITDRTDGVPLFVEELTKSILESGSLTVSDSAYIVDKSFRSDIIPATLHDSLLARLDRLTTSKEIAQTAACIGREFSLDVMTKVCDIPHADLEASLEELKGTGLVHQVGTPPRTSYQFKHALVRDAAYETLLKKQRRKIHKRILNALETDVSVPPELLATHAEAAAMTQRAIRLWEEAAKLAIARPAYKECEAHLKRAIALNEPKAAANDKDALAKAVDLHVQLFVAQSPGIGFWSDETVQTLEVALDLADRLGETPLRGDIVYGLVLSSYFRGSLDRSIVSADELNLLARASGDEAQLLVAQRLAGVGRLMSGKMNEAAPYLQKAEDLCANVANQDLAARFGHDPIVGVYIYQSMLASFRGQTTLAENYRMLSERRAKRVDHTNTTCTMYGLALFCAHIAGDISAERSHLTNMRLLVEEHAVTASHLWAEVAVALLKLADGENAIDEYWRSERGMLGANINLLVAGNRVLGARRIMDLGHPEAARTMADAAEAQMQETGEQSWLPELYRVRAAFARQDKDEEKAGNELSEAISAAQRSGAVLWELRASLDLASLYIETNRIEPAQLLLASLEGKVGIDDCPVESALARKLRKTISLTA